MQLILERRYHQHWTEGSILCNEIELFRTMELAWKGNTRNISCIPEGIYSARIRQSSKYGLHIEILNVPSRSYILIHPANDARKQLRGCIAPVLKYDGYGKGRFSRLALEIILSNMNRRRIENCLLIIREANGFPYKILTHETITKDF